jgi:hypothetical protein
LEKVVAEVMIIFPQTFFDSQISILCFLIDYVILQVNKLSAKHNSVLLLAEELQHPLVQAALQFVHQHVQGFILNKFQVYRENIHNLPRVHELLIKLMSLESNLVRSDWLLTAFLQEFEHVFSFYNFRFLVLSILQKISVQGFSQEISLRFIEFLCEMMHFQIKNIDFPELYILFNMTQFCLDHNFPLQLFIASQKKDSSETLNLELLKGFFKVFMIVGIWKLEELTSLQSQNLFKSMFSLLKYHFILAEEENLLLLITLLNKIQEKQLFVTEISVLIKKLLSEVKISGKFFGVFTLGLKHLLIANQANGHINKAYFKSFKDFLYTVSEHVKKGYSTQLFYQNCLLKEVFSLVKLINSKSHLRESFNFMNPSRNFIFSLMDDEQVLKKDIIRLLDEDLLIIEFNCSWDYTSDFLSHLHKLADYSLAQKNYLSWNLQRRSKTKIPSNQPIGLGLSWFVTPFNLFELDRRSKKQLISEPQRVTAVNELVQVNFQVFTYPQNNVLLIQLSIHNITKILIKHLVLNISSNNIKTYPQMISIGKHFPNIRGLLPPTNKTILDTLKSRSSQRIQH